MHNCRHLRPIIVLKHDHRLQTQNPIPEPTTLAPDNLFSVAGKVNDMQLCLIPMIRILRRYGLHWPGVCSHWRRLGNRRHDCSRTVRQQGFIYTVSHNYQTPMHVVWKKVLTRILPQATQCMAKILAMLCSTPVTKLQPYPN